MEEQRVSFETALLAKEHGIIFKDIFSFNYSCYIKSGESKNSDSYKSSEKVQDNIPTQSLLQRWLRENHKLDVLVYLEDVDYYTYHVWGETGRTVESWNTYEDALEVGLQEALKLIKL